MDEVCDYAPPHLTFQEVFHYHGTMSRGNADKGNSCLSIETVVSMLQSSSLTAQFQYVQLTAHCSSLGYKYFVSHTLLNKYKWQTMFSSMTSASQTF
jgi:hypothetical protein